MRKEPEAARCRFGPSFSRKGGKDPVEETLKSCVLKMNSGESVEKMANLL